MTTFDLARLRSVAEAAKQIGWWNESGVIHRPADNWTERNHVCDHPIHCEEDTDAEFVGEFDPPTCVALLAALAEAQAERDRLAEQVEAMREAMANVQLVGGKMSNLCFNVRQQEVLWVQDKQRMNELYQEWDAANRTLHAALAALQEKTKGGDVE